MKEGTVAASFELEEGSRGMIGSFCLETIVTDKLEFSAGVGSFASVDDATALAIALG